MKYQCMYGRVQKMGSPCQVKSMDGSPKFVNVCHLKSTEYVLFSRGSNNVLCAVK